MNAPIVRALGENPEPPADDLEALEALEIEPPAALLREEDEEPERRGESDKVHPNPPVSRGTRSATLPIS